MGSRFDNQVPYSLILEQENYFLFLNNTQASVTVVPLVSEKIQLSGPKRSATSYCDMLNKYVKVIGRTAQNSFCLLT